MPLPQSSNNGRTFRSGFAAADTQPNPADWVTANDTPGTGSTDHLITQGGNSAGSSYLRISLSPFKDGSEVSITSVPTFEIPTWSRVGMSLSQRISGQEVFAGLVGSVAGDVELMSTPADLTITGATISITTNVGTVSLTNHGLNGGDRVTLFGCPDTRMNVGPVVVTVVDSNTFTIPITIANGSYTSTGGKVRLADPFQWAYNGTGVLHDTTTATTASFVTRRNGSKFRTLSTTVNTSTAVQSNTNPYTDAFNSATNNEITATSAEVNFRSFAADGVGGPTALAKFTQTLPDEAKVYKIRIRARNLKGMTMPVARITNIAKTGTTTATVTTDVAHGLTTNSWVQIYGVLDQTNFPNLTAQTQVASVIDATNFTIVIGGAVSISSSGGTVWLVQGSTLAPGVFTQVVQSVSRTSNIMTLVGNGTWATPLPGEYVQVWGMTGSAAQYDGAYKVLRVNGTALEVASTGTDFGSIGTGGAVFRRTDVRLHFVQNLDYLPLIIDGGRGNISDINNSLPVSIVGGATLTVNANMAASTTTNPAKAEDAAHASGDVGVQVLGVRYETNNAAPASAAGDYSFIQVDDMGKLVNSPYAPPINQEQGITAAMTATASTAVIAAAGASIRHYITDVTVTNTHATVGTEVDLLDGAAVVDRIYVPALTTKDIHYLVPIKGTANTAFNAQNVTTGSNTYVSAHGFKSI